MSFEKPDSYTLRTVDVLLADQQALTNMGLKSLLTSREDLVLVDEASHVDELCDKLGQHQPALLILDHQCVDGFRLSDVASCFSISNDTQLLIITADDDRNSILALLDAGVKGFLTKNCSQSEIIEAIVALQSGKKFFCSTVLDVLLEERNGSESIRVERGKLSPRERQVLQLIAQGLLTKQIAEKLSLSPHTINSHRKNIIKKLAIKSSSDFVLQAIQLKLI